MLTRRDVLRAQSYVRRRLAAAFVTGSPEVAAGPARPWRPLGVGVLISALVLAASYVIGQVRGQEPAGWLRPNTLVVEAESGRTFLVTEHAEKLSLTPVPNQVSARLLAGQPKLVVRTIEKRWLQQQPATRPRGLVPAPDLQFPVAARSSEWSSCASPDTSSSVRIAPNQARRVANSGVLVRDTAGAQWLVADGPLGVRRYRIGPQLSTLPGLLALPVVDVSDAWLALILPGTELAGSAGEVVATTDGFLLRDGEQLTPIGPFAALLQEAQTGRPAEVLRTTPAAPSANTRADPSDWPEQLPSRLPANQPCLVLHQDAAGTSIRLGSFTPPARAPVSPGIWFIPPSGWLQQQGASEAEIAAVGSGEVLILVDSWGQCFLVTDADTISALGLPTKSLSTLPTHWTAVLPRCSVISAARARAEMSASGRALE